MKDYYQHKALYRPISKPDILLPFGLRSVGHYIVDENHQEKIMQKKFIQLFWGIKGKGRFLYLDREFILPENHIFCYLPGDFHRICGIKGDFEYRWLTIDGKCNSVILESFGLSRNVSYAGPCPEELFVKLEKHIHEISPYGQRANTATAFQILTLACGVPPAASTSARCVERCVDIIHNEYGDQNLNISSIADRLSIHRTTISRQFKEKMGISPLQYLNSYRVQKALSLLKETSFSVSETANLTGFDDPNYFCKVIKKATGENPTDFRKL